MRRLMLALATVLALTAAPAAQAGDSPGHTPWPTGPHAFVYGKIVAVDAAAGTVTADVRAVPIPSPKTPLPAPPEPPKPPTPPSGASEPPYGGGDSSGTSGPTVAQPRFAMFAPQGPDWSKTLPAPQRVTITTTPSTIVRLDDQPSAVGDLATGDEFMAGFNADPSSTIDQIVATPAVGINAHSPRVFYGLVGSVTAVDKTAHTLTISLLGETPGARGFGLTTGQSLTFTVGDRTMALELPLGTAHGTDVLDNVSVGDIVAAGYLAPANATLAALLAQPLNVLVDIPLGSTGTGGTTHAQSRALKLASSMLGSGKRSRGHHTTKSKRHSPAHALRK